MCRILGTERQREITIHTGRHSFVSHALAGPNARSLAEVRDAVGHPACCRALPDLPIARL